MDAQQPLYSDAYLDVYDDHLVLKGYYFWKLGKKRIAFSDIAEFREVRLSYYNGLSRHEQAWLQPRYPFDWKVKGRKEAFYIRQKGKFLGIGVSAEHPHEVALLLHKRLHLDQVQPVSAK